MSMKDKITKLTDLVEDKENEIDEREGRFEQEYNDLTRKDKEEYKMYLNTNI